MANRLADQTSPYLRQHADNPVDWYPWGEDAFGRARADDKPLLVSIGYSACHWCHVMAHESFEDPEIAGVLNDLFVNVKVDREERPDIDAIYMEATQAMTGSGGWPMTVFVTPDGKPFFCGTYFPPERRQGMPSLLDVCRAVDDAWQNRRDDVENEAGRITDHLRRGIAADGAQLPGKELLTAALRILLEQHDEQWGGFGRAPKFPQGSNLDLLLRAAAHNGDPTTLVAARTTLDAMAAGGIYDHLGGGFARYSVDNTWLVPHFEKMLDDQALLIRVYLHAWQLTGEPAYRQVLDETVGYVLRDLRHPDGGFYSAEDADSEGAEGRFYLWTADQIRAVLGEPLAELAIEWYGVTEQGGFDGRNILNRIAHHGDLIRPPEIEEARQKLFDARTRRVRPGLDDKVLTEWNGLMIASLAEAAAATGERAWLDAAVGAAEFLEQRLRDPDRRWYRSWHANGGSQHPAFAADHAAVVDAFSRLAEATGEARWIAIARDAAETLCERFWDDSAGGFYTTTDDDRLVARHKDLTDDATPSANSLAAVALLRLAALTGEETYRHHADGVLRLLGSAAGRYPAAFGHLLAAVDLATAGITEVVVAGDRPDLVSVVQRRWQPNAVLAWGEPYGSPLWEGRTDGRAYVCHDFVCNAPTADPEELATQLDAAAAG